MSTRRNNSGDAVRILLVEDNPADVRLTREALREAKVANGLEIVEDGVEAIEYLNKRGRYRDARLPDLILLDLNLPRMDGREVLAQVKADPEFARIPIVILTTSKTEEDVIRSYELHANCFITKPVDFEQFAKVVQSIERFWFEVVKLPPRVDE